MHAYRVVFFIHNTPDKTLIEDIREEYEPFISTWSMSNVGNAIIKIPVRILRDTRAT